MEMIRQLTGWDRSDRRRILQIVLGVIWLVDAALQFQPYMFTRSFVTGVLEPSAQGRAGIPRRRHHGDEPFPAGAHC